MIKKWHEECILFLDDCFSNDKAVEKLAPHFTVKTFTDKFHTESKRRQQGIKDPSVITACHDNLWLLITNDHEMQNMHSEEIRSNPHFTAFATAHNSTTAQENQEWLNAIIKLKPTILRYFKKKPRPWFATFSREAKITKFTTWNEEQKIEDLELGV